MKTFDENSLNAISDAGITLNWIFSDLINENLRNFSNEISRTIGDIRILSNELSTIDVTNIQELSNIGAQLKTTFEQFNITTFGSSLAPIITSLTQKNNDLSQSLLSLDASRIINVGQEINKLDSKAVNYLRTEIDTLSSSISLLSSQSGILNKFISGLDVSKVAKLGNEITKIDISAITKLQSEISKLQITLNELTANSKLLNDSISSIDISNISNLKNEISDIDVNAISTLQKEIAALYDNLNNLTKQNLALNTIISKLDVTSLTNLNKEIDNVNTGGIRNLQTELNSLQTSLTSLSTQGNTLGAIVSKLDLTSLSEFNTKLSKFSLDTAKSVSAEISSIDKIIKDISLYSKQLNGILESLNIAKFESVNEKLSTFNYSIVESIADKLSNVKDIVKTINSIDINSIKNLNSEISVFQHTLQSLSVGNEVLSTSISNLDLSNISKLSSEISTLKLIALSLMRWPKMTVKSSKMA